jgi:AraC family transcriptional regulator
MDEAICASRAEPTFDREACAREWPAPPVATVDFSPADLVKHVLGRWRGLHAETIQVVSHAPFEYGFKHTHHLLVAIEQGSRYDGELLVEGLPTSKQRGCSHKLILVPAGRRFFGWQRPRALTRSVCLYIDPSTVAVDPDCRFDETELEARMLFDNSGVWHTVEKLKALIGSSDPSSDLYAEALGGVLAHELLRLHGASPPPSARIQGGLAGWQQKRVTEFIEAHLADGISLAALADQVQLSRFHFARAFKESFGEPPCRYLTARRIDRAKALLARPHLSVTTIALDLGFGSSSAFTVAFRRIIGRTPSAYRRMLV